MSSLDRLAYSRESAAAACDVSLNTIKRAINRGDLAFGRTGRLEDGTPTGKYVITRKALEDWLQSLHDA